MIDPLSQAERINHFGAVDQRYSSWKPTGIDPEKDPNLWMKDVKPTGATDQSISQRASHVDYTRAQSQLTGTTVPGSGVGAAQGVPPLDYFTEDYHRDFSNVLGEVAVTR